MTADTLTRCKCGDPMTDRGICMHCDRATPGCTLTKKHETCETKLHKSSTCPRCVELDKWLPQPGDWDDLPKGYKNNA